MLSCIFLVNVPIIECIVLNKGTKSCYNDYCILSSIAVSLLWKLLYVINDRSMRWICICLSLYMQNFNGRNMTQCAAHVCIIIIRIRKRSVLKRICVQGCICRSVLILFLQLNPREYNFPKLMHFWQLNLVRFIQNNSYCNNLTL